MKPIAAPEALATGVVRCFLLAEPSAYLAVRKRRSNMIAGQGRKIKRSVLKWPDSSLGKGKLAFAVSPFEL